MYTLAEMSNHEDDSGFFNVESLRRRDTSQQETRKPSQCKQTSNRSQASDVASVRIPPSTGGINCVKDKVLMLFIVILIGMMLYKILE